jgi:O-antigen/teichoic acid export membrane protein
MSENPAVPPGYVRSAERILSNTGYRAIADIGSKIASFIFYVVMARRLGGADFGVFMFGLTVAILATTLSNFGQDATVSREVARNRSLVHDYFVNALGLKLALSVPVLLVVAGAILFTSRGVEGALVVLLLGVAVIFESLMSTCFAVFQAFERLKYLPLALISERAFTAIVGGVAIVLGADVVMAAAIFLLGAALGLLIAVAVLLSRVVRPRLKIERQRWLPLLLAAAPVGLFTVFAMTLFRADTAMLAFFKPNRVVGDYSVAYRLFETTLFLSWSVEWAVYPVFARLTRTSIPTIGLVLERALKLVTAATLPLAVGAAILATPVIRIIYSSRYDDAATALALLAPTIWLYPLAFIAGALLIARNRVRGLVALYAAVALENIVVNLVLIPKFSLNGAAFGTSASQVLLTIPVLALALQETGRVNWLRIAGGPLIASAVTAALMIALAGNFASAVVAAAAAYVVVLAAWEWRVYPADARFAVAFLRRRTARLTAG